MSHLILLKGKQRKMKSVTYSLKYLLSYTLLFSAFNPISYANNFSPIQKENISLVGLYVNDQEISTIDVLQKKNNYYLPLNILVQEMGISPQNETALHWQFHLPLGDVNIEKKKAIYYKNVAYLPLNSLEKLGINALFNPSLLAIKLYIPWDKKNPFNKKTSIIEKAENENIDFYPELLGVSGIHIQGDVNQHNKQTYSSNNYNLNIGLDGFFAGGLWGADLKYDALQDRVNHHQIHNDELYIDNLYWVKSSDNWAIRLGNSRNSYGLNNNTYTGITFAYSNKGIIRHLADVESGSQQLLKDNQYSSIRNIEGLGPAGGVAELRVNGRPVARVRIGLDKKYKFIGLDLAHFDENSQNVEVAIFKYSLSEPPIEIQTPFLSNRRANVATDEWLIEGGIGRKGNLFNQREYNTSDKKVVSHLYTEYGLTNNIAVRGDLVKLADKPNFKEYEKLLGLNIGLPLGINVDIAYQDLLDQHNYDYYLEYDNAYFSINYNYQRDLYKNNANTLRKKYIQQNLNLNLYPLDNINLGIHSHYSKIDNQHADKYFTAYLNAKVHQYFNFNVHRDRENDYFYGINWEMIPNLTYLNIDANKNKQRIHINHKLTENLNVGASIINWKTHSQNGYRAYIDYDYNDKHQLHIAAGYHNHQNSYDLNWQYDLNEYAQIHLGYRKNNLDFYNELDDKLQPFEEDEYFYLSFSIDLFNQNNRIRFGDYQPSYYGSIITNLNIEESQAIHLDDNVQFKLDEYPVVATKMSDQQYIIENIKVGNYKLSLPTNNLPLEYQRNQTKTPIVKVARAVPTIVNYQLVQTFGISGKVLNEEENQSITVYQKGKKIAETQSGAYGYYQIIGLPKGEYEIKCGGKTMRKVNIKDQILFNIDL